MRRVRGRFVQNKAKEAFRKNAQLTDEVEIKRAVARGRWMVRELVGVIQLKKYRTLKRRYDFDKADDPVKAAAAIAKAKFDV
jgi:hypothetical protein